ncbi:MAG: DUF1684 domain-containing protein [Chloroflexi bacterium]|nr:DUF1684 domain-containing protein [Chloroflexota bacterium]
MPASPYLELQDWRRRMAELFADVRQRPADAATLGWFRASKDALFREHPQSPIPEAERPTFKGLPYWPLDPALRVAASFKAQNAPPTAPTAQAGRGEVAFRRIGHLEFELSGEPVTLAAFWIEGYAGGLFVPFKDATTGHETYGGGRYLLDTIKSADLGSDPATGMVVLDFNYAYHPSCTYDPQWVCPLAPPDSRLAVPIRAGERLVQ